MSQQLITTSNADRNLAAGATVLSATPDASNPRMCYALILLGDGTKNLTSTGGAFSVTITIAGNTWLGGAQVYTVGTAVRAAFQTEAFFVPANAAVTIAVTSPNAGDTDVDCTAYLVSENGPSNQLETDWTDGGRLDLLLDAVIADAVLARQILGNKHTVVESPTGTFTISVRNDADDATVRTIVYIPATGERTVS